MIAMHGMCRVFIKIRAVGRTLNHPPKSKGTISKQRHWDSCGELKLSQPPATHDFQLRQRSRTTHQNKGAVNFVKL